MWLTISVVVNVAALLMMMSYRALWRGADRQWRKSIERSQNEIRQFQAMLLVWEEKEASVCPEDVGFVECIERLRADTEQGHACNACLKDQLENGKRQCCVSPDSCDVDGEILRLRAELADKLGELDAECRVSQLAIKEVGNLQSEVKRLEVENLPNPLQIELKDGRVSVAMFRDDDGAGIVFKGLKEQHKIGETCGTEEMHIPEKGEVYVKCFNLDSFNVLKDFILQVEQALKENGQ